MTPVPRLVTAEDAAALADRIARDLHAFLVERLASQDEVTLALTGGGMGIGCLRALAALPEHTEIDWPRVRLIWGDERWLPLGDPERNETQAREALLDALPLLPERVIAMPASDEGFDLDEAAEELARRIGELEEIDLVLLGVGPDAHVASLFPNHPGLAAKGEAVIAVRNSPKAPPERLSLSLSEINRAERVWLFVAGAEKREAFLAAAADRPAVGERRTPGTPFPAAPASRVRGRAETVLYADTAASNA